MMLSNKTETIYIELDCILDTRLGTIARINKEALNVLLESDSYWTRETDVFEGIDSSEYRKLYQARDVETLQHSMISSGIQLLRHIVNELTQQAKETPYLDDVCVVVNTYPYKLDEDTEKMIGQAIALWLEGLAPNIMVHLSPEELTPKHCNENYSAMIVYEYEEWMNMHAKSFEKTRMQDIMVFAPALYNGKKPTEKELEEMCRNSAHPFQAVEMLASPLVGLQLIEPKYFSIIRPS